MLTKYLLHTPQPLLIINTRGTKYTEDAAVGQNSTAFQDVVEAGFKPWRSGSGTFALGHDTEPFCSCSHLPDPTHLCYHPRQG